MQQKQREIIGDTLDGIDILEQPQDVMQKKAHESSEVGGVDIGLGVAGNAPEQEIGDIPEDFDPAVVQDEEDEE